jgi:hypothetical protein
VARQLRTVPVRGGFNMDYIAEAKKFIQRAVAAHSPEVVKEHLKMADWCLGQEIERRDEEIVVPKSC